MLQGNTAKDRGVGRSRSPRSLPVEEIETEL